MATWSEARIDREVDGSKEWTGLGENLYLRFPGPVFYWRGRRDGKIRKERLGKRDRRGEDGLTLREAREAASKRNAADSLGERVKLGRLIEDYLASPAFRAIRDPEPKRATARKLATLLGDERDARKIGRGELIEAILTDKAAIQKRGHSHGDGAASRLLVAARQVFGYGEATDRLDNNIAANVRLAQFGVVNRRRARVLSDDEVRELWEADTPFLRLCRFQLLTGARRAPVIGAPWCEIEGRRWTFRLKSRAGQEGRLHWVHLPDLALAQIGAPMEDSAPLLPHHRGGHWAPRTLVENVARWNVAHGRDLAHNQFEMLPVEEREANHHRLAWTSHALRATFVTRVAELGRGWNEIGHLCAGHERGGIAAHYDFSELESDRCEAAELLAERIKGIL